MGCQKARREDIRDDAVFRMASWSCAGRGDAPLVLGSRPLARALTLAGMGFSWQDRRVASSRLDRTSWVWLGVAAVSLKSGNGLSMARRVVGWGGPSPECRLVS